MHYKIKKLRLYFFLNLAVKLQAVLDYIFFYLFTLFFKVLLNNSSLVKKFLQLHFYLRKKINSKQTQSPLS